MEECILGEFPWSKLHINTHTPSPPHRGGKMGALPHFSSVQGASQGRLGELDMYTCHETAWAL